MIYITRKETFSAAHRLSRPDWPEEQNREVFGKCSNPNWHGHNYELYVTVKGEVSPENGFVANLSEVSAVIKTYVLDKVDHRNLNLDVDFMKDKICSTENLVAGIWDELEPYLPKGVYLHGIRLYETPRIFVEYFGTRKS